MKTKQQHLKDLRIEANRLIERISEAETDLKTQWPSDRVWASVKRATLELNRVGIEIRKAKNL